MEIALIGNTLLRMAIRQNLVSFPSQVPSLMRRQSGDTLERVVQLYFLRGWSVRDICGRYRLSKAMVQKLLSEWRIRAVAAGYIQDISPEDLETLARTHAEHADDDREPDDRVWDEAAAELAFEPNTPIWAPAANGEQAVTAAGRV